MGTFRGWLGEIIMGNSPLKSWGILILGYFTVNLSVNEINNLYFEGKFLTGIQSLLYTL